MEYTNGTDCNSDYDSDDLNAQDLEENIKTSNEKNDELSKENEIFYYRLETLKDDYQELEEKYNRLQRDFVQKSHMFENLSNEYNKLKEEYASVKELSNQIDRLIEDHGLLDEETMQLLNQIEGKTLEEKINKIIDERNDLSLEIRKLQNELNDEQKKNANLKEIFAITADQDLDADDRIIEEQKDNSKLVYEYKFQLKKTQQELDSLQNNINRLEAQLNRYKQLADEAEATEEQLKADKRKLLRDFREAQQKIDELETENSHFQRRIEKLKNDRLAIINGN